MTALKSHSMDRCAWRKSAISYSHAAPLRAEEATEFFFNAPHSAGG